MSMPLAGTGTVMRQGTVRRYATGAGYSGFEVLPIETTSGASPLRVGPGAGERSSPDRGVRRSERPDEVAIHGEGRLRRVVVVHESVLALEAGGG
jgi:hypothetical protein